MPASDTKCDGYGCDKKETCFRFTCIPNPFQQTYGQFGTVKGECQGYIETASRTLTKKKDD